ncbi:MAG: DUF1648 domain-containing protein, partial [Gemmiger sp.]|nr:DUF1648 domain-containing protein [Gemmiger sp.]
MKNNTDLQNEQDEQDEKGEKNASGGQRKKPSPLFWVLAGVSVVSLVAHLVAYPSLPDIVPSHWDAAGNVNGHASKTAMLFLDALPLLLLLGMQLFAHIDPKKES